ncbi:MAG: tetraacyldisaccharide 4'-kinase [Candidatus Omnitrophica bacterium]|nr:tetraacyldisaccharide 4'-kinase [Candidatus Omnitrophota bacterium]
MLKVKSLKEKIKAYYIDLVKGKRKGARVKLFSFFLLLFSFVYGFFVKLVLSCYQIRLLKSHKIGCRVISVGNITWGGTGKTPLVETLVKVLKQKGRRLAILIRGYGKDEVEMLKSKFKDIPVLVGRDRIKAARVAQERYGADTIILDDGFQHWRLRRDLDIVLIDTSLPFGNRRVIPRGILREPLSSLSRADAFVLTRTNEAPQNVEPIKKELRRYNRHAAIYEAIHAPTSLRNLTTQKIIDLSRIKDEQIAALSGIGTPESFTRTLKLLGAKVSLEFHFPDHYQYSKEDLEKIERQCLAQQIKTVITTEKDAARLIPLLKPQSGQAFEILALRIEVKIVKEEERFFNFLNSGKGSQVPYFILILSDGKAGHLNQSKAVAQIIRKRKIEQGRRPDEVNRKIVEVKFKNRLCQLLLSFCPIFSNPYCHRCFACLRFCLKKSSFEELMQARACINTSK